MKDKLAIIVPYRDRQEHLDVFVPHMREFLKDKGIDYEIFIAEQTDDRPFNYGKLCNVVVKEISEEYTYFAFHDIDMLPISDDCDYGYPDSPTHLATNVEAHENKLPYPQYFGGVILISREDFENANGYSNEYWGYGFEDLDLLYRLQRSGAYLEKFYDLNQTYDRYDENDILPYRIENVDITNNQKTHKIQSALFDKDTKVYGPINKLTNNSLRDDFFISLWFNDFDSSKELKNIFTFEGCDMGLFLSDGKYVIGQVWDTTENHFEVSMDYSKEKWNHVVFAKTKNILTLYLNNNKIELQLKDKFQLYDYTKHCIKISDNNEIEISDISLFSNKVSDAIVSELFFNGNKVYDLLKNKYGLEFSNDYIFSKIYRNNILLDSGKNLNHLPFEGILNTKEVDLKISQPIYLPVRLDGQYKSLIHDNDSNIINNYYNYNPDIEENSDIFFNEVIPDLLDYKKIGLSSLEYKILDKQNRENYELVRIVT